MRNLAVLGALALSLACQPAPKPEASAVGVEPANAPAGFSAEDEAAIRAVDVAWAKAASAGDAAALRHCTRRTRPSCLRAKSRSKARR